MKEEYRNYFKYAKFSFEIRLIFMIFIFLFIFSLLFFFNFFLIFFFFFCIIHDDCYHTHHHLSNRVTFNNHHSNNDHLIFSTVQGSAPFVVAAYIHNIAAVELSLRGFFATVLYVTLHHTTALYLYL
jgi:hypothetical protein